MTRLPAVLLALALLPAGAALAAGAREQGEAALRAQDTDRAAELLEQAVAQAPKDAEAHSLLAQAYGAQANAGGMITKMRLAGKIREHFERAVALAPEEIRYREALLEYYVQAPSAMGGGADKAQAQAAEIARRDQARGLAAAGRIAQLEGNADEALAKYRQAAAARPDDARIALRQVIYLQELKRWPEAFKTLDAFLAANPGAGTAWYQLGRTAVLANTRHADGERAFRRFISMPRHADDPPLEAAHWRLGMLYEQMNRKAEAKQEYQRALQLNPGHKESKAALKKLG